MCNGGVLIITPILLRTNDDPVSSSVGVRHADFPITLLWWLALCDCSPAFRSFYSPHLVGTTTYQMADKKKTANAFDELATFIGSGVTSTDIQVSEF